MCTKEDPIEFLIELDKLDLVQKYLKFIVCKVNWDDYLYSKLPTSTVPKTVNNAEIINTILAKSWEIQGGDDTKGHLMTNSCYVVNTLLMYYFKSLNIAHNMKRVVGSFESPRGPRPIVHSFLKFGDHVICNTFVKAEMEAWKNNSYMMFQYGLACKYNDVDPADPKYGVDPNSSDIGLKNERFVYGNDEKAEQFFVQTAVAPRGKLAINSLYDLQMRKFIKEKYGFEIENLGKKWKKLCWNCFALSEDLKKCSKCRISRYCGKDCQRKDWKAHKVVHDIIDRERGHKGLPEVPNLFK